MFITREVVAMLTKVATAAIEMYLNDRPDLTENGSTIKYDGLHPTPSNDKCWEEWTPIVQLGIMLPSGPTFPVQFTLVTFYDSAWFVMYPQ